MGELVGFSLGDTLGAGLVVGDVLGSLLMVGEALVDG